MGDFSFPQYGKQQKTGNIGEIYFENFVTQHLEFIYRKVHRENDFGIDGYIDIVDDNHVTGRSIAVQIKCGDSYFSKVIEGGIRYIGENKHLNFLLNLNHPVILVVMNSNCSIGYWTTFSPSSTNSSQNGWWIEIPKTNILAPDVKTKWMAIAGLAEDYTEKLQISWQANSALDGAKNNLYVIHKEDIEHLDFTGLYDVIERAFRTKELAIKNRNKLDILIFGYDDDPRELYEIPEVRNWFQVSIEKGIPWFYLLNNTNNMSLIIFLYSCCIISVTNHSKHSKQIVINSSKHINEWLEINFHNLNIFIDSNHIPEWINEEISNNISIFIKSLPHG